MNIKASVTNKVSSDIKKQSSNNKSEIILNKKTTDNVKNGNIKALLDKSNNIVPNNSKKSLNNINSNVKTQVVKLEKKEQVMKNLY